MKKMFWAILLVFVVVGYAATMAQPTDRAAAEKQIIANERAVLDAFAKADAPGFKRHLSPDAFGIDPMMGMVKVADWEKSLKDVKVENWDIDTTQVHWIGDDAAILTYRWTGKGTFQGQPIPSPAWASTVWVHRDGAWRALFHQESVAVPAPAKK
jgi:hypothetical protein